MEILYYILGNSFIEGIANISGYIAIGILIYGLLQKDDIKSIQLVTISLIFWMINYWLLGLTGALYATIVALIRMYFSFKYKGNKWAIYFIISLNILFGFMTYESLLSIYPIIAGIIAVLAFQLFSGIMMRIALLIVSIIWLIYMSFLGNLPGIINEIIMSSVLLYTIYKMYTSDIEKITYKQKIALIMKFIQLRPRIDFGRYGILRDTKRYFNKNINVYYEKNKNTLFTKFK